MRAAAGRPALRAPRCRNLADRCQSSAPIETRRRTRRVPSRRQDLTDVGQGHRHAARSPLRIGKCGLLIGPGQGCPCCRPADGARNSSEHACWIRSTSEFERWNGHCAEAATTLAGIHLSCYASLAGKSQPSCSAPCAPTCNHKEETMAEVVVRTPMQYLDKAVGALRDARADAREGRAGARSMRSWRRSPTWSRRRSR